MSARRERERERVFWKAGDEAIIRRYVAETLALLSINNAGEVQTTELLSLEIYLRILVEKVELKAITDPEVKYGLLNRSFFKRLKIYKRQDIYYFRRALATEVRNYFRREKNFFWILLPLHVSPGELGNARSINILGTRLFIRNWDYLQRRFDAGPFFTDARRHTQYRELTLTTRFIPVFALAEGRDIREAFNAGLQSFDMFRWLINMNFQFGRWTFRWGGYPEPLGTILPPPVYGIFRENGDYETLFYNTTRYSDYPANQLDNAVLPAVRRLSSRLSARASEDQTLSLLLDALEKYGEALDTFEWRHSFLSLWQILELITLQTSENLSMKVVRNRIVSLLGQDPITRDLLSALYETRNLLVHRGYFPDEQGLREVNLLKIIAERAINRVFSLLRTCPQKTNLLRYYENASSSTSELRDRQRIIRNILHRR